MSEKLAVAPAIKTSNVSKLEKAACPNCDASLKFYRSDKPDAGQDRRNAVGDNPLNLTPTTLR